VHVITRENIRRSGVETIPDLLRTVPGVQVAELDVDIYAISIRGFNDIHANKLLASDSAWICQAWFLARRDTAAPFRKTAPSEFTRTGPIKA
jgi:hypothetical protein